jgi:hypothetical protein
MTQDDDHSTVEAAPVLAGRSLPSSPASPLQLAARTLAAPAVRRAVAGAALALGLETVRLLLSRRSGRGTLPTAQFGPDSQNPSEPQVYGSAIQITIWIADRGCDR